MGGLFQGRGAPVRAPLGPTAKGRCKGLARGGRDRQGPLGARMPRATATMIEAEKVESQCPRTLPASPRAFRMAARAFLRLPGVDVVWLAVRESREQAAVIRSSEGARSAAAALGLQIEPAVGVGGALLLAGDPWR